jgi:hypothetical protein
MTTFDITDYAFTSNMPVKVFYSADESCDNPDTLIYEGPLSGWFDVLNAECDGVEAQTDRTEAEIISILSTDGSLHLGGGASPEVTVEVTTAFSDRV